MPSEPGVPKKKGFKKVTKSFRIQGGARRERAQVRLTQHGQATGNAEMTEMVIRHAIARGVDPKGDLLIDMGTDDEREVVAIWPVAQASPGTTVIRIQKNASACSFHIGGALEQSPTLRPLAKKSKCLVSEELDEQNLPVLVIPTKAGKATNTTSRSEGQAGPGSQAAGTENDRP